MKICTMCHQEKQKSEFNKNRAKKDGLQTKCRDCSRAHSKNYYKDVSTGNKERLAKNRGLTIQRARNFILSYLNNHSCIDCGEDDPIVLEFDHIRDKFKNIGDMIGYSVTRIKEEIDKCEVRCANCHRRKTAKEFGSYKLIGRSVNGKPADSNQ